MVSTVVMSNSDCARLVGVERHLDVEGLLDGEDRLDEAERVDAEIGERRVEAHVARLEHGLLGEDRHHLVPARYP